MRRTIWHLALALPLWVGVARAEPASAPETEGAPAALSDAASSVEGRRLYGVYCASCHGREGGGDGPAGLVLQPRPARFTDPAFWGSRDDAHLRTVIRQGGPAVGRSPLMAGFAGRLDASATEAVVTFLRASFGPPAPATAGVEAAEARP